MSVEDAIKQTLTDVFSPSGLKVLNQSHLHAGHASSPGTGESHFKVEVVSDKFAGLSRLERHRLVNEALGDQLAGPLHALSIRAVTQAEAEGT